MTPDASGLEAALGDARRGGRKILVPFLTAGWPDPDATARALSLLPDAGADAIELGVPFSDPLADGPVIAAASLEALRNGMTVERAVALGGEARGGAPLVLFTYLNPLLSLGATGAAEALADAGFGGALVADLPFDEGADLRAAFDAADLPLVPLAAPTTPPERLAALGSAARGFVYLIARTGVTGQGSGADRRLAEQVAALRDATDLPIVVGFGIADADAARRAAVIADGIVVGSAFVRRMGDEGTDAAVEWIGTLREALDRG